MTFAKTHSKPPLHRQTENLWPPPTSGIAERQPITARKFFLDPGKGHFRCWHRFHWKSLKPNSDQVAIINKSCHLFRLRGPSPRYELQRNHDHVKNPATELKLTTHKTVPNSQSRQPQRPYHSRGNFPPPATKSDFLNLIQCHQALPFLFDRCPWAGNASTAKEILESPHGRF